MGTINSAFSVITGALNADQAALSIVANNVANANTTGYTEEVSTWKENQPIYVNGVLCGTGVSETGASSVRDRVLNQRLNQQQQLASGSATRLAALGSVQALFTPDSGNSSSTAGDIGSDITSFFNSFSSLEANPTNDALRQKVLSTATTLSGDISNAARNLQAQQTALGQEASGVVSQVNALTSSIAQLNMQIQSTSPNGDAGALEDQRQLDLNKLSQLIGINQNSTENNGLSLTIASGQALVSEGSAFTMTAGKVNGVAHFFIGTSDVTAQIAASGGSMGGYITARDQDIPAVLSSLDQLAYSIATNVNTQNNAGTDLNGDNASTAALNIFTPPVAVSGSAASMSVVMTDPSLIAAAALGAGTGDNSNAVAMAAMAGQGIVNGSSPSTFYSSFVTALGSTVAEVQTDSTAQTASVSQLQNQNNALTAVSLNGEAASMQQFERSYQAASQVFTILNTLMNSALNLGTQTAVS
ncbi:MAG TPA: flagellar hook-associated protein FlgK [Terracidiphilus sp.]|jgi:flagellar hook-associated protein 1 FlgK